MVEIPIVPITEISSRRKADRVVRETKEQEEERIKEEIKRVIGREPSIGEIEHVIREREEAIKWKHSTYHKLYCKNVQRVAPLASEIEQKLLKSLTGEIQMPASEISAKVGVMNAKHHTSVYDFIRTPLVSEFNIASSLDKEKGIITLKKSTEINKKNTRFAMCIPYRPPPTKIEEIIKLIYEKGEKERYLKKPPTVRKL